MLIAKGERRFTGFDDKIIAMYARGMSVREIQGFLLEMDGIEVSPDFISTVTRQEIGRSGAQGGLSGTVGRSSRRGAGCAFDTSPWGTKSPDCRTVAPSLGLGDSVLCLCA